MVPERKDGSSEQSQPPINKAETYISLKNLFGIIAKTPLLEVQQKRLRDAISQAQGIKDEEITFLPKIEESLGIEKEQEATMTLQQRTDRAIERICKQRRDAEVGKDFLSWIEGALGIEKEPDATVAMQQRTIRIISKLSEQNTEIRRQNQGDADFLSELEEVLELKCPKDTTAKFDPEARRKSITGEVVQLTKQKIKFEEQINELTTNLADMADPHETVEAVLESLLSMRFSQLSPSEQLQIFYALKDLGINFDRHKVD